MGCAKYDILSGESYATTQWLVNMGETDSADPANVFGDWANVEPSDREVLNSLLGRIAGGETVSAEQEIRVRDGDGWKWVLFTMIATDYRPTDGVTEIFSTNLDISRFKGLQRRLTDAIRDAEQAVKQRDAVLESLSSALIYIDRDYVVQWSTVKAIEGVDYVKAGARYTPGKKCYSTVFNRDEPCKFCSFCKMLATGERTIEQFDDNGSTIEVVSNPVFDGHGTLCGGLIQLEDITARCKQERKLRELNHVMDAILNHTPVYIFVKNPNDGFRYIYWNRAMADYTKVPVEKVLGNTDWEVFPRKVDADKFHLDDIQLLKSRENLEFQEEYVDADGCRRVVHTLKTLIPVDEELPWLLGMSWDITDLKETEAELIKAKERAEESDRFKSMFLANMSHEIRTPLNAIVGFAELLMDDATEPEEREEYITIMRKNTRLLLQLISDILDLSRIEAQDLEYSFGHVNLHALCGRIAKTGTMQGKAGVPVLFDEQLPECSVWCDENRAQQVITNFVNNAMKFTEQGTITISYRRLERDEVEISVADTGVGIPPEKVQAIFDRFVKLNSFVQGSGLGLSICKSLVEQMNGRIGVESTEGAGSRFWFTLPTGPTAATKQQL